VSVSPHHSPLPQVHRTTARATLTTEEISRAVKHARNKLLGAIVTGDAVFGETTKRDEEIKKAIRLGIQSVVGGARVQQPKLMWKDVVRTLNKLAHAWKTSSLIYALSAL